MKYFKITVWQGHFGTGKRQPKTLYICADDLFNACIIARKMPSIQHHKPVINAVEIDEKTYNKGLKENKQKPFVNNGRKL